MHKAYKTEYKAEQITSKVRYMIRNVIGGKAKYENEDKEKDAVESGSTIITGNDTQCFRRLRKWRRPQRRIAHEQSNNRD